MQLSIGWNIVILFYFVKDLMVKVEGFQAEAQDALCDVIPDSEKLKRLLESGKGIDIELPEIPKLKQVSLIIQTLLVQAVMGSSEDN